MVKKFCIIGVAVIFGLAGFDVYRSFGPSPTTVTCRLWDTYFSPFRYVEDGMSEPQVLSLLGKPLDITSGSRCEWWDYEVGMKRSKDEVSTVFFGPDDRVTSVEPAHHASPLKYNWPRGEPKIGMTKQQVRRMLGRPDGAKRRQAVKFWRYRLWNGEHRGFSFGRDGKVCDTGAVSRISIR